MTTTNKFVSRLLLLAWKTVFISCAKCERETWQQVGIICNGCDFTVFWVFQVSFWNVDLISDLLACVGHVMSTFSQAEAMIFLLHLLLFHFFLFFRLFKILYLRSCPPPHPFQPQTHTHRSNRHMLRWKTCFSCLIPVIWVAHNCHLDFSSVFPPFPPSFYFRRNDYPWHSWLWGKDGGDSTFFLDKLLDSVVRWAITKSLVGFYSGTCVFYTEYRHCWNDSWKTMNCIQHRGTTVKTGKTDNFSHWTYACKLCM